MADLIAMLSAAAGAGGAAPTTDPFFNQTTLLLHGDGTNGAQNNTFLDSSSNTFTITRNGNTTQGTFSPFSAPDGRWSNYFDGTDDGLSIANVAATQVGSNNFTFQCWFYPTSDSVTSRNIFGQGTSAVFSPFNVQQYGTEIAFMISQNGSSWVYGPINAGTVLINDWNHVAVVRDGTGFALFLNGTRTHNTTLSGALMTPTQPTTLGVRPANDQDYIGWISNWQLVNGTALYDPTETTCTVPTSPLPTGQTDQELLLCYSNRFVDSNTDATAKTVTVVGDVKVTPFSPFLPSAAYDPSVNGGSGYFDGTGDYLTAPSSTDWACAGDYAVEAWVYIPSLASDMHVFGTGGPGAADQFVVESTGRFYWFNLGTPAGTVKAGAWNHLLATRSGTAARGFVNGVLQVYNASTSGTVGQNLTMYIGERNSGTNDFNGYISNIRYINGSIPTSYQTSETSVAASVFTPPTTPFTATSQGATSGDVKLLTNFTNAGIFDNTGKNNLETAADAQIDTSVKKYGTGSMEFDGTGDFLLLPASPYHNFGTGDFTIEMWLYVPTGYFQTIQRLVSTGSASPAGACYFSLGNDNGIGAGYLCAAVDLTSPYDLASGNPLLASSTLFPVATWTHVALVRSGSSVVIYQGGVSVASVSNSAVWDFGGSSGLRISGTNWEPATENLEGFIDDLRITKGVARYTAAFTPPTAAFPDL
jgi:hypothetical protein